MACFPAFLTTSSPVDWGLKASVIWPKTSEKKGIVTPLAAAAIPPTTRRIWRFFEEKGENKDI